MKQNLYIFSDVAIKRKNNTLLFDIVEYEKKFEHELEREEFLFDKEVFTPSGDKKYMPVENVDSIFTFGKMQFNSRLIYFLSRNFIPVYIFDETGKFHGAYFPAKSKNSSKLLLAQAEAFLYDEFRLLVAVSTTKATLNNELYVLKYYAKRGKDLTETIGFIHELKCAADEAEDVEELLGIEGSAKREYYSAWRKIFNYEVGFTHREHHPAPDYINAMISFGNALLYGTITQAIYRTKLYPELGFIHSASGNKFSLAYDFADIYKPLIVDKLIFKLINKEMLNKQNFIKAKGQCLFDEETKKLFVEEFRKQLELTAPDNSEKRRRYKKVIREDLYTLIDFITRKSENVKFFEAVR